MKTVQELLRHANPQTTLQDYTQAVSTLKRKAQRKVMRMVLDGKNGEGNREVFPSCSPEGATVTM